MQNIKELEGDVLTTNIVEMRNIVSYLGEHNSWWKTKFYQPSAGEFLAYLFPRSSNSQFLLSCSSTRSFIDNEVGSNHYHLFRLPIKMEKLIGRYIKHNDIKPFESVEVALQALKEKAANLLLDGKSGPKHIGSSELLDNDLLQVFA